MVSFGFELMFEFEAVVWFPSPKAPVGVLLACGRAPKEGFESTLNCFREEDWRRSSAGNWNSPLSLEALSNLYLDLLDCLPLMLSSLYEPLCFSPSLARLSLGVPSVWFVCKGGKLRPD